MWKTVQTHPRYSIFDSPPVRCCVRADQNGKQPCVHYQDFVLSFGVFSESTTHEECLKTWPREAIKVAREHLDRFEAWLREGDA